MAAGNFSVNSAGFDVTTAGAVSGVTTLAMGGALSGVTTLGLSGAITGPTTVNTINGLIVNSGALSGITGYSQSSGDLAYAVAAGNFSVNSAGFDVTTAGAVSGVTTLGLNNQLTNSYANAAALNLTGAAAGITFTQTGGSVNFTLTGAINTNDWDISAAGALTGITGITNDGAYTQTGGGNFAVDSAGFDVTAAGAVSGVTTLAMGGALSGVTTLGLSGAITGPTTGNTINGLVINAGALSGITGLTMGGTLAMGTNNITMTGTLGATGARLTKGWFTDLEVTNSIVAAGGVTAKGSVVLGDGTVTGNQPMTIWLSNHSGATLSSGAIVIADLSDGTGVNNSFTQAAEASTATVLGILYDANCIANALCRIAIGGVVTVNLDTSISVYRGQHVVTSGTNAGRARGVTANGTSVPAPGASIGVWLENVNTGAGGGTARALLR
ncbi:MAG: hypothetical protein A3J79_12015 [Elusimicrobia bacterium RIFOXYB2_FULL_62_6]|nr:MAG: hypothetical protein A3J79_12015 [Elusimicrobia bacterium RIFOXYB2_FULL_62_6]